MKRPKVKKAIKLKNGSVLKYRSTNKPLKSLYELALVPMDTRNIR